MRLKDYLPQLKEDGIQECRGYCLKCEDHTTFIFWGTHIMNTFGNRCQVCSTQHYYSECPPWTCDLCSVTYYSKGGGHDDVCGNDPYCTWCFDEDAEDYDEICRAYEAEKEKRKEGVN
tara:strand:- start:3663 stop:4016 length:354 start_codon:yes stop_codon:yes gene_type:complete